MTKRKALQLILIATVTMFTTTATTVAVITKLERLHTSEKEYGTVPSTTTQAPKILETQTMSLEERRSKLMSKCRIQSNLSLDTIAKLSQEILDEGDEGTKKYFFCIFQGIGVLDDKGNIALDPNVIKQWIPGTTDEMLVVISQNCLNIKALSPEDLAIPLMKCFLKVGQT